MGDGEGPYTARRVRRLQPGEQRDHLGESVMLATPHKADWQSNYGHSLTALGYYDAAHGGHLIRAGGPFLAHATTMNLHEVRNAMCQAAIDKGVDWLLFVDSDAGFAPDVLEQLLRAADPATRPVLGGLAFAVRKDEPDDMGGWRWSIVPTIYDWGGPNGEPGFFHRFDFPDDTLVQAAATGCHLLLIHRSVLEKIRADDGPVWFNRGMYSPEHGLMGEDFSFCFRLLKSGMPLYVHTGIETTHQQPVWINRGNYDAGLLVSRLAAETRRAAAVAAAPDGVKVAGAGRPTQPAAADLVEAVHDGV